MNLCDCTALTKNFDIVSTALILYLDALKFCGCPEFKTECEEKKYDITNYYSLVYDKMCNSHAYNNTCLNNSNSDTLRHCNQIDEYRRGEVYDDWFIAWTPFCRMYAYGASQTNYNLNPSMSSPYNNMPSECQRASIFALVIFYLLCVLIIIANVTVLMVVRLDPYFHTPYGYFKASIAVADLLVGIVVVPNIIYLFQDETFGARGFRLPGEISAPTNRTEEFFDVVGFFTLLSLCVSVYSLALASMDRYYSISHPFKYKAKKFFTRRKSLVMILGIWILAAIFALFPFMTSLIDYYRVSATFILAGQRGIPTQTNGSSLNWIEIFNMTSSKSIDDVVPIFSPATPAVANVTNQNTMLNASIKSRGFADNIGRVDFLPITSNPKDSRNDSATSLLSRRAAGNSSEIALYFSLSLYLFSLFLPLVIVWTVNICTIRSYSKKREKSNDSVTSVQGSIRSKKGENNQGRHPQGNNISASTSLTSIHLATCDESKNRRESNNKNQTISDDQSAPSNNFLSVPDSSGPTTNRQSFRAKKTSQSVSINSDTLLSSFKQLKNLSFTLRNTRRSKKIENVLARRMQRILLRMVIAFTVSILPAIVALVLHIFLAPYTRINAIQHYSVEIKFWKTSFSYVSSVFLFGNSFVNCIIYTVLGKRFREVAKKIYSGKIKAIRSSFKNLPSVFQSFSKQSEAKKTNPKIIEETIS